MCVWVVAWVGSEVGDARPAGSPTAPVFRGIGAERATRGREAASPRGLWDPPGRFGDRPEGKSSPANSGKTPPSPD